MYTNRPFFEKNLFEKKNVQLNTKKLKKYSISAKKIQKKKFSFEHRSIYLPKCAESIPKTFRMNAGLPDLS